MKILSYTPKDKLELRGVLNTGEELYKATPLTLSKGNQFIFTLESTKEKWAKEKNNIEGQIFDFNDLKIKCISIVECLYKGRRIEIIGEVQ